jgi:hypothetical protein
MNGTCEFYAVVTVLALMGVASLGLLVRGALDLRIMLKEDSVKHGGIAKFNSRTRAWFDENCKGDETDDNR